MGAPTSSILSEVYLQHVENTMIYDLLIKHKVEGYFRYADDILVMYKDNTNIYRMLDDNLASTMKFTLEEQNNKINFLDITIAKNHMV
jgi:ABC-type nitrate/sulfonate/bicarbonate transport system ATPase subunit